MEKTPNVNLRLLCTHAPTHITHTHTPIPTQSYAHTYPQTTHTHTQHTHKELCTHSPTHRAMHTHSQTTPPHTHTQSYIHSRIMLSFRKISLQAINRGPVQSQS